MENENLEVKIAETKDVKQKLTPVLDLLESSISIWWKNFKKFLEIYVWAIYYALIPLVIIFASTIAMALLGQNISSWLEVVLFVLMLVSAFAILYFSIRAYAGMFLLVKKNYQGEAKEIFKETSELAWPYIVLSVLTAILIILWLLLLIIPGIIFSVYYSFAVYAFFFEDKRGMDAIKRSKELVKGYWWAVFGRVIFFALIIWVFSLIISIPLLLSQENSIFYSLWDVLVQIINALIGPITLLFSYQIYKDLVKIKS